MGKSQQVFKLGILLLRFHYLITTHLTKWLGVFLYVQKRCSTGITLPRDGAIVRARNIKTILPESI